MPGIKAHSSRYSDLLATLQYCPSAMDFAFTSHLLASRTVAHTPATIKEKSGLQEEYTKDLWVFLASVITFFTLVNVVKKSLLAIASRAVTLHKKTGGESVQPGSTGRLSLRRLSL